MKSILSTTVASTFVGAILLTTNAFAADGEYTILNPTPDNALRPLRSDIADRVVGPYTVDAGHFQLEADLLNYFTTSDNFTVPIGRVEASGDAYAWAPTFKLGLCERADFEVRFSYAISHSDATLTRPFGSQTHFSSRSDGFGPVNTAFKINLWGNDNSTTALALLPFLSIPTDGRSDVAGGVGLPFAVNLPEDFSIKIYQEVFFFEGHNLEANYSAAAALHRSLLESKVDLFADFTSTVFSRSSMEWVGYAGFGGGYNFTPNCQAYAGLRFGITSNAYDYNPYLGLTWRY